MFYHGLNGLARCKSDGLCPKQRLVFKTNRKRTLNPSDSLLILQKSRPKPAWFTKGCLKTGFFHFRRKYRFLIMLLAVSPKRVRVKITLFIDVGWVSSPEINHYAFIARCLWIRPQITCFLAISLLSRIHLFPMKFRVELRETPKSQAALRLLLIQLNASFVSRIFKVHLCSLW